MGGRREETAHRRTRSTREFAGRTATIAAARHFAADAAAELGCDADTGSRVALVVSELASNAIEASARPYSVTIAPADDGGVVVSVTNRADRPDIPERGEWGPDEPLAARGRGLGIVEHLAAAVDVAIEPATVTVTAVLSPQR